MNADKTINKKQSKICDNCEWELPLNFFNIMLDEVSTFNTCKKCHYNKLRNKYPMERYIEDNEGNQ